MTEPETKPERTATPEHKKVNLSKPENNYWYEDEFQPELQPPLKIKTKSETKTVLEPAIAPDRV